MTNLTENVQSPTPGELVTMFQLDTSSIGGPIQSFCAAAQNNLGVTFNGVYYTPTDVSYSGFEMSGSGGLPTPKIKVSNSNGIFQAMLNTFGDLVGCTLTRIRTFAQYLDGAAEADPTALFGPDIFLVERKSSENPIFIEWELSSSLDNQGAMIPKRMVIRDTCTWRYRVWNMTTGAFDYTKAQCPYTGAIMTAQDAASTDPTQDGCGRMVSSCKLSFGATGDLPYGGFAGVARFQ